MTEVGITARDGAATVDALLLGGSPVIRAVRELVFRAAPTNTSVLITGPSGSGKERIARSVHVASARAKGPFVAVNCGAIPRDLLESELFGHEKGSFTGAHAQRQGRFEQATGGTLFLDEIGDMPHDMQVKLLRVLEERRIERVGGRASLPVDVRIVSATHRDLKLAIENQQFREDLYFRLAVFPIHAQGLAAHPEDIPELLTSFLRDLTGKSEAIRFASSAWAVLAAYDWPGNIRELRNFGERALILHEGKTLLASDVEALLLRPAKPAAPVETATAVMETHPDASVDLRSILSDIEARYIKDALARSNGVVADAARLLGLQRTTLIEKMRRYAA